jgi:hypothetical protein
MGELLRRGFDAQLADRNTAGYDLLVGSRTAKTLVKVQVKTVRAGSWYVKLSDFTGEPLDRTTIYVLLGDERANGAVRYFIAKNRAIAESVKRPSKWTQNGYTSIKALQPFENKWDDLLPSNEGAR